MPVSFIFNGTQTTLTERLRLKSFIESIFKKKKRKLASITYIFCSDTFLLDINRRFLNHDYYTDIITFNLSDAQKEIIGEVYISVDRVKENAQTMKIDFKEELHRVIFHGALHLCGYTDKAKADKIIMTAQEDICLKRYFK
jgi:rRNA maturation RNase YbeY